MKTLLSHIGSFFNLAHIKRAVAVGMMAVLVLLTPAMTPAADAATMDAGTKAAMDRLESKGMGERPRTTGQFQDKKESLAGQPGKVVVEAGKDLADATGEVSETVGQTVKDLIPGVESKGLTKDDSNR